MKLTDFGLATGALNPRLIEDLKQKVEFVRSVPHQLTSGYIVVGPSKG